VGRGSGLCERIDFQSWNHFIALENGSLISWRGHLLIKMECFIGDIIGDTRLVSDVQA
jgi:hypothetical protein